jgi:sugar fermentation stimulation protein A
LKFRSPFKLLSLRDYFGELFRASFLMRLNRFTLFVEVNGVVKRAHLSDSGRLKELLREGAPLLLAPNPKGKLDFKAVAVRSEGEWVLINTSLHSPIAELLISRGILGFKPREVKREVSVGNSRIDFLLDGKFFLEVKGCNLKEGSTCLFPDAPTERGARHVAELLSLKRKGFRAALLFLVFRNCSYFSPNFEVDPKFSRLFLQSLREGVEFFAFKLSLSESGEAIYFNGPVFLSKEGFS